ncbi:MAG: aminopeptidase P family protein [Gemmatimonadetes bacterium]|nr:aminopeptidase P family protein [Gemmatimonadota bacterium]
MERREFLRGALGTLAGVSILEAQADAGVVTAEVPPSIGALTSAAADAPPAISEAERAGRRALAQRFLTEMRLDALLIEPGPNLMYYTGVPWGRSERLFAYLLPQEGTGLFVCPAFEQQKAETLIQNRFPIHTWQEDESPYQLLGRLLRDRGIVTGTLTLDGSARYFLAEELARAAPALTLVAADPITRAGRGVKSAPELALARYANQVTLRAFRAALETLREDMTQAELGRNIRQAFDQLGYSGGALVLFGEASAYPHGVERPEPLREGMVVLVDGGTSVHGYASDVTRTVVFGTPTAEQQRVFDIVREAQARALRAARPGQTCGEIDAVARTTIEQAGFGPGYRFFTHRLGHGIGLEGHEWPYLVRGSTVELRPGMTFSNEPGIYQYGKFGVRLEDIMVITDSGGELLTEPARSLSPTLAS